MGRGLLVLGAIPLGATAGLIIGAVKGHEYAIILPIDTVTVKNDTSNSSNPKNR